MKTIQSLYNSHPNLVSWTVLAVGMVVILILAARDVGFEPVQWLALIVATVLLAGLCAWIIGWEDGSTDGREDGEE